MFFYARSISNIFRIFGEILKSALHLLIKWVVVSPNSRSRDFNMKLNGRCFPQIVDRDSGNLCPIYIQKIVLLASEPVGGRSRATDCLVFLPSQGL